MIEMMLAPVVVTTSEVVEVASVPPGRDEKWRIHPLDEDLLPNTATQYSNPARRLLHCRNIRTMKTNRTKAATYIRVDIGVQL